MRAYGLPRVIELECPDLADIKKFGLATSDRCSRRDRGKNKARRYWKKLARRQAEQMLREELKWNL